MKKRILSLLVLLALGAGAIRAQQTKTVTGYVLDSACAITKNLSKPTSPKCAVACARKGSPLMVLGDDGNLYLPVTASVPSTDQNPLLMIYAGQHVTVIGQIFESHGAKGIQIQKIQPAK